MTTPAPAPTTPNWVVQARTIYDVVYSGTGKTSSTFDAQADAQAQVDSLNAAQTA